MTRLSLALLGPVQILLAGQPVGGFTNNKARALLAYLAVETYRPHQRDALATLLWPEMPDEAARHNLRQALTNLRTAIGDASATPSFLLITRDTIQFNPASDYDLDISTFMELLRAFESHAHRHLERCRSCTARMEQAITVYRGDFLAGFSVGDSAPFEEWQLRQRERLHQQALDTLTHLADYHERRGEDETARRYAQRQIELEPWREEAHRQLMRLLARSGQRSAALARYESCRRILAGDLGVEPEAETTALYEQIRDNKIFNSQFSISRHNFPAQTTPLIGRETEVAELGALLENPAHRLITIVGTGGIGKTRLALAAAAELADVFADGAAFVPLQAISSAAFVASAILSALDTPLQGQRNPRDQLLDYLREKELLLVLDNFEQLLAPDQSENEGGAALLADILQRAPGITLFVTSRGRLALPGEWLFDLAGLSCPAGATINGIEDYNAVRLFLQRARQVRRHFALADGEACAVARICRLIEGLPLAIELAAAALRTRSCTAIAEAIETSLSALTTELRAVPERQRSIRATFEHSWRLLSDEERRVFPRLSVFRGGFEEQAAVEVAQASPQLLAALLDKSLLRWDGVARYDMHELVRQYAGEKLEQVGEAEVLLRRHAEYYLALAEAAESQLKGAEQQTWLVRLEQEHANLGAALAWGLQELETENEELRMRSNQSGSLFSIAQRPSDSQFAIRQEVGLRLVAALARFWDLCGYREEWRIWVQRAAVALEAARPTVVRAKALLQVGRLLHDEQGDQARGVALVEESLALASALGDQQTSSWALHELGQMMYDRGDIARGIALVEQGLALAQAAGDTWSSAHMLYRLAELVRVTDNYARARALLADSLALLDQVGDSWGDAQARGFLALVAMWDSDFLQATTLLEQSLVLNQAIRSKGGCAWTLRLLAEAEWLLGDYARAAAHSQEALALYRELGDRRGIVTTLHQLGDVTREQGDCAQAIALFEECQILYRELNDLAGIAGVFGGLGDVLLNQADATGAAACYQQAVTLFRELKHQDLYLALCGLGRALQEQGDDVGALALLVESLTFSGGLREKYGSGICLAAMAGVWVARGQPVRAARLFGASQALRGTNAAPIGAVVYYTRDVASVRAQLDEATFAGAWAEGEALTLEQAVAEALNR
jgi:predicted ATPase/DNA-binding SARP family transcriptional activator/tetratricopeptide (TPR) repeat protein